MNKHEGVYPEDLQSCLETCFGYHSFLEGQRELATALLSGRDVVGVLPPGGGKSLCYQLPAMMREELAVVITPSPVSMREQMDRLIRLGIPVAGLGRMTTPHHYWEAIRGVWQGRCRILYVSPEKLMANEIRDLARGKRISLIAIEEADRLSAWSQDFDPVCRRIPDFLSLFSHRPPVGAYTAAATPRVQKDIRDCLGLHDPAVVVAGFARANLRFDVIHSDDKEGETLAFLREHEGESGIICCATRQAVEELAACLLRNRIEVRRFHEGLTPEERNAARQAFEHDKAPLVAATGGFFPGTCKKDIRFVLHYNMPLSMETYIREAGYAGRDGEPACCRLLYSPNDVVTARSLLQHKKRDPQIDPQTRDILVQADGHRLHEMIRYCQAKDCLANRIRACFGEKEKEPCGICGSCTGQALVSDVTQDARKILDCVFEVHERYGSETLIRILRGSRNKTIHKRHLDELRSFGTLSNIKGATIRSILNELIMEDVLQTSTGRFPVMELGQCWERLREDGFRISIRR